MITGSRQRINNMKLNISINQSYIEQTYSFKLLGVVIDEQLKWKHHISALMKKLSAKIGLVKRLQPFLPSHIIHKLYTPLLQSHIDYCLTVWGKCSSTELCKLQRLHNRAARIFSKNFNKNVSVNNILNRLEWMTVSDRYKFLTSCFIYKCLNDHNVQYNMENTFISKFKYTN